MIPEVGSVWKAGDGRVMRVDEVIVPPDPADMPWARLSVLNATKGMRKRTTMNTGAFDPGAFLQPFKAEGRTA